MPHHTRLQFVILATLSVVALGCPDDETSKNNSPKTDMNPVVDMSSDQSSDMPVDMPVKVDMAQDMPKDMVVDQPPEDMTVDQGSDMSVDMIEDMTDMAQDMSSTEMTWRKVGLGCRSGGPYVALHFDGEVGYMGCGNAARGEGLYMSFDGGRTWNTQTAAGFGDARIVDIRRGPDNKLYAAGKDSNSGNRGFIINDSNVMMPTQERVFIPMSTSAFRKVERGQNIAIASDGQMFIDNVTGTQAAYKPAVGNVWDELEAIGEEDLTGETGGVYQITKVRAYDNKFYAVGSVISDPASVRLPSKKPGATYHFQTIQPVPGVSSELRDFHRWSDGSMLVVGHDNDARLGMVIYADKDPYDVSKWSRVDLTTSGINYKVGVNRLAVMGDLVIAVGERIPTAQGGFVWRSKDRGRTWEDITPSDNGRLARRFWHVWMWSDGSIYAAGESEAWLLSR